jgi:ABC-2 type transport system permease protein
MSLFFASKAIYPLSLMPTWLRTVSVINALTYQVDILRALMLKGGHSVARRLAIDGHDIRARGLDFGVQLLVLVFLIAIARSSNPRLSDEASELLLPSIRLSAVRLLYATGDKSGSPEPSCDCS